MNKNKLKADSLIKKYREKEVVKGVSIDLNQGEVVGLLGPNGAGKTTTFYMITGLVRPSSGDIFLKDQEITNLPMYKRSKLGLGYLSQEPSVFQNLSIEDNLKLVLEYTADSIDKQNERLEMLLNEFSIQHIRSSKASVLSGGERRRLEIARTLIMNPEFILLDEPFAGIDPIAVEDIQKIIVKLKEQGIGILITDHNVRETLSITDRSYILYEGKVLISGSSKELINNPSARKIYLGSKFKM